MSSINEVFNSLSRGEVLTIGTREDLEAYIEGMFKSIEPQLLLEKKKKCEAPFAEKLENWTLKFTPFVAIYYSEYTSCDIEVGFKFFAEMTSEFLESEMAKVKEVNGTKTMCSGSGYDVVLSTSQLNLEKFFNMNEEIFYFDRYTGKKHIYDGVLFKDEAHSRRSDPDNSIILRFDTEN